ncbi:hypothetical protein LTR85_000214 [Meristemomyces frigidus]|nr:hypothetical protein LTR85_000214 [Meristemomyces frigidus]
MSSQGSANGRSSQDSSPPASTREDDDLVLRQFGIPGEALEVDLEDDDYEGRLMLTRRFELRRDLAALARFPEGFHFVNRLDNGFQRPVLLLTPPNQVAVQHEDGTWSRQPRQTSDGPSPVTQELYQEYLDGNNLPNWFLSPEHVASFDDEAEAIRLGTTNVSPRQPPPPHYLNFRYPVEPQYPLPDAFGDGKPYAYCLSGEEKLKVARLFPATNITTLDYRIYILPTGRIVFRQQPTAATNEMRQGTMVWQEATAFAGLAAYRIESANTPLVVGPATESPPRRSNEQTEAMEDGVRQDGGLPALGQRPQGLGHWEWLQAGVDDVRARALGFANPEAVELARQEGLLSRGMGPNAGPITVWYPDQNFFNPLVQPGGPGHWAYHTAHFDDSDRAHAILNFGNQAAFGFGGNHAPAAREIWQLRQQNQARIRAGELDSDPTEPINLVWIPGELDPDIVLDAFGTPESHGSEEAGPREGHHIDDVDPNCGERHEPYNRGEHDQTGDGTAQYHTRLINGRRNGNWQQYPEMGKMNWLIKEAIDKLNRWKEAACKRNEWPGKRLQSRLTYSDAERAWIFERVKSAGGGNPTCGIPRLTADFNNQFPGSLRTEGGLSSEVQRQRREYHSNAGQMKQRQRRGANLTERHAAARKAKAEKSRKSPSSEEAEEESGGEGDEDND